jgi:hypothetical protein
LPEDLIELRGAHSSLLQLLEGLSGVDTLVLARVANEQHLVVRPDATQKFPHLFGAGEARFIDHVQMPPRGVLRNLLLAAAGEETLQRLCGDACLAELLRSARSRGEALDRVAVLFRSPGVVIPLPVESRRARCFLFLNQ